MIRYLIRRLLWACALFVVITIVTFVIFFMIPVNPAKQACGQRATPTCIKNTTHTLGLDRPVSIQYLKFMDRLVLHQNLGRSFVTRQSVNKTVLNAAPVSASLVFGGAIVWMLIALPVGILVYPGGELLSEADVPLDSPAKPVEAEVAQDEPELEGAEAAPELWRELVEDFVVAIVADTHGDGRHKELTLDIRWRVRIPEAQAVTPPCPTGLSALTTCR